MRSLETGLVVGSEFCHYNDSRSPQSKVKSSYIKEPGKSIYNKGKLSLWGIFRIWYGGCLLEVINEFYFVE